MVVRIGVGQLLEDPIVGGQALLTALVVGPARWKDGEFSLIP